MHARIQYSFGESKTTIDVEAFEWNAKSHSHETQFTSIDFHYFRNAIAKSEQWIIFCIYIFSLSIFCCSLFLNWFLSAQQIQMFTVIGHSYIFCGSSSRLQWTNKRVLMSISSKQNKTKRNEYIAKNIVVNYNFWMYSTISLSLSICPTHSVSLVNKQRILVASHSYKTWTLKINVWIIHMRHLKKKMKTKIKFEAQVI